jgi:single-strand DNA-binding protein
MPAPSSPAPLNRVVLRGEVAADPVLRDRRDGGRLLGFDVTTRPVDGAAVTAPVVWFDPPAAAAALTAGGAVVVIGTVRRRFFVAGGATQSRTEVVADVVLPASRRSAVRTAISELVVELEA